MDVLLHHVVQLVIGLEHPVKHREHHADQDEQPQSHQRQHHAVDDAQPGADGKGVGRRQNQHHGAADRHTDQHLEGHLDIRHIRGQPGDNGRGGEFIDVAKIKILHLIIHIVAQVPGKARGGVGRHHRGGDAENQGNQGVQHQQAAVAYDGSHVAHADALVHHLRQHQRDFGFHVNLAHHADRGQNRGPFVLPDTPGKRLYHVLVSSFSFCLPLWGRWQPAGLTEEVSSFSQGTGQTFSMARCKNWVNSVFSSWVKP